MLIFQVGTCAVFLTQEERTVNIPSDYLSIELPETGERCKFIYGEFREQIGKVESIDRNDAVVQTDQGEIKYCPLIHLAKFAED
jgi:hypothetical protein